MSAVTDRTAPTDTPVIDAVAERWSTRIFDGSATIDEAALASSLEAARWASSAFNAQPWRFIVARRGTDAHAKVFESLIGFNQGWADTASALVVFVAVVTDDDGKEITHAQYDTGQAASFFAVQAHTEGLHTHQMSGFDADAVHAAFALEPALRPITVMAVGTLGDPEAVSEKVRERESAPRTRRTVEELTIVND